MKEEIKYTGDWYENMQQMIRGFLFSDYDSYEEWYSIMSEGMQRDKELTDRGKTPLGESDYYLIKQELEKIFERREEISLEELEEYVKDLMEPDKRHIFIYLLVIYEDFYKEDENYRKDLVEAVKKDFKITEEEMNNYRV